MYRTVCLLTIFRFRTELPDGLDRICIPSLLVCRIRDRKIDMADELFFRQRCLHEVLHREHLANSNLNVFDHWRARGAFDRTADQRPAPSPPNAEPASGRARFLLSIIMPFTGIRRSAGDSWCVNTAEPSWQRPFAAAIAGAILPATRRALSRNCGGWNFPEISVDGKCYIGPAADQQLTSSRDRVESGGAGEIGIN